MTLVFRSTMLLVSTYWKVVLLGMLISSVIWLFVFPESLGGVSNTTRMSPLGNYIIESLRIHLS